jgi:hypothetical protein
MSPKVHLKIGGSGGLYQYFFGVLSAVQDTCNIEDIQFETSSGSGFPVGTMCINLPLRLVYRIWEARKTSLLKTTPFSSVINSDFYDMVFAHTSELCRISGCDFTKSDYNRKHTVSITRDDTEKIELINSFKNIEDYAHCLTASASIPFPWISSWKITTRENNKYFDGGLSKQWWKPIIFILIGIFLEISLLCIFGIKKGLLFICLVLSIYYTYQICRPNSNIGKIHESLENNKNNDLPTIVLETNTLNGNTSYGGFFLSLYYMLVGLGSDEDWLYHRGRIDGKNILAPQLKEKGVRNRPHTQLLSTSIDSRISTLHTRFDRNLHQFVANH